MAQNTKAGFRRRGILILREAYSFLLEYVQKTRLYVHLGIGKWGKATLWYWLAVSMVTDERRGLPARDMKLATTCYIASHVVSE